MLVLFGDDTPRLNRWVNEINSSLQHYLKMFHSTHFDIIDVLSVSRCENTVCGLRVNSQIKDKLTRLTAESIKVDSFIYQHSL